MLRLFLPEKHTYMIASTSHELLRTCIRVDLFLPCSSYGTLGFDRHLLFMAVCSLGKDNVAYWEAVENAKVFSAYGLTGLASGSSSRWTHAGREPDG